MQQNNSILNDCIKYLINDKYKKLNDMQKQAVFNVEGPLLVLAGAGSGKTSVIVNRIRYLIEHGNIYHAGCDNMNLSDQEMDEILSYTQKLRGDVSEDYYQDPLYQQILAKIGYRQVKPWNILAITFTNKAANELKDRLFTLLGDSALDINTGTFHSICIRILRRYIESIGYERNFTIYDTSDTMRIVKDLVAAVGENEKIFPAKSVINEISRAKDKMITYKEYQKNVNDDYRKKIIGKIYEAYQKLLSSSNALDFDDIIFKCVELFTKNSEALEYYQNRYKYILVDEYQDTNYAQYKLISMLAEKNKNLCVVGDDDQSIYSFRGATVTNILNFENEFSDCSVIRLEQNYRSTQTILDAANGLIENNNNRKSKKLWTSNGEGNKIKFYRCEDDQVEADYVCRSIIDSVKQGKKYNDNAILYRMNAQSANIERFFIKSGIPYKIIGNIKFFERKEVKDIISYLAVINNTKDSSRLKRIINEPKRGIGDTTIKNIEQIAIEFDISMFDVICGSTNYELIAKKSNALNKFKGIILGLREKLNSIPLNEVLDQVIELTGYDDYLISLGKEGQLRLENLEELKSVIIKYQQENPDGTLSEFLEEVSLYTDLNNLNQSDDNVIMMTVHSAKGLEFENVFIIGMEEGIFPGYQSIHNAKELEEERRLAYVGITRAKQNLHITNVKVRMLFGSTSRNKQSRFIDEIPEALIEIKGDITTTSNKSNNIKQKPAVQLGQIAKMASEESVKEKITIDYSVTDRVEHNIFGEGTVVSMKPMGNDVLVEVIFEKIGTKKIMANFANLKKL